jgi:hypothetical protein
MIVNESRVDRAIRAATGVDAVIGCGRREARIASGFRSARLHPGLASASNAKSRSDDRPAASL